MPRQKSHASKKVTPLSKRSRLGESSRNLRGEEEEQELIKFPQTIIFGSELQHKIFEDIVRRKIQPNRYPNKNALITVGLIDEVSLLLQRVG